MTRREFYRLARLRVYENPPWRPLELTEADKAFVEAREKSRQDILRLFNIRCVPDHGPTAYGTRGPGGLSWENNPCGSADYPPEPRTQTGESKW